MTSHTWRARLRRAFRPTLVLGALVITAATASAQTPAKEPPSAANGHAFAQRFCSTCHLVDGSPAASVPVGIPSFRSIANRPDQTGSRVADRMIEPHPPMPDIHLTATEILNILAYLDTMRTDRSTPLLPPSAQGMPKPKYPEPS